MLGRAGQDGVKSREAFTESWKAEIAEDQARRAEEGMEEEEPEAEVMMVRNWNDYERYMEKRKAALREEIEEVNKVSKDLPSTPTLW